MPWNEPGGDKDPWNGKKKSQPPSGGIDDLFEKISGFLGGSSQKNGDDGDANNSGGGGIFVIGLIALAIWGFTGFYTVDEGERGVVLRFGEHTETTTAGLHWHLPYPIENVEAVNVDSTRTDKERTIMLTKDENIVDLAISVQYKISKVEDYLFNVANIDGTANNSTLHQVMRSAIREVVGRNSMDSIIKDGRELVAQDTGKVMQTILDSYKAGIIINKVNLTYAEAPEEVKDAFDDANRAREDKDRYRNEAIAYEKKVVPAARGRAARVKEEADAYKAQLTAEAEGDASRFSQLLTEYQKAPEVTRQRLYLETMEDVLGKTKKVMLDAKSGNNIMMLPIQSGGNGMSTMDEKAMAKAIEAAATKKAQEMIQSTQAARRSSSREPRSLGGR